MKKCLVILLVLTVKSAFGQLNDSFSDGEFDSNPVWTGSGFQVNASQQLQTSTLAGTQIVALATSNAKVLNVVWEFYLQINLDPTPSNRVRVYLISDNPDLKTALNGYFLQIGENGQTDSYDLYRQDGASITKIIDGPAKTRISNTQLIASVRVTRDIEGLWEVLTDITGGTNYVSEGTKLDLKYIGTSWFGLRCEYTSGNSDKFIFDDFSIGNLVPDSEPPQTLTAQGIDGQNIEVTFNEPVTSESALNPANYSLNNNYGQPTAVKPGAALNKYLLEFNSGLNSNNYTLTVQNLVDFNLNTQISLNTLDFNYIKPYIAQPNDVVINEIFADPSPQIDLPALEFIELWNNTEFPISLDKWTYGDASTTYTFGNITLQANEYALVCASADVANFSGFGKTIGISPWPSLNNSGDQLSLKDANGTIINQVNYTDSWYKDALKKEGGWTLELMNPKALCTGIQNWSASTNVSGGTPGKVNAIYQPNAPAEPLKLLNAQLLDESSITLNYNRYVDSASAAFPSHYALNNGVGQPVSAIAIGPEFSQVELKFGAPLTLGMNYTLTASQVSDCSGILLAAPNNTTDFFLPEKIKAGDILINELLFNPRTGGADFVEIYNNTDHPLDLKDLQIGSLDQNDQVINLKTISSSQILIQAKTYRVLSTNTDNILAEYQVPSPENLLNIASLPAFNDDAGSIVLMSNNIRIDQFSYTENMHFPLIKNAEGVSLERSSFSRPANEAGNFRSAAASVGFATPGYQNSQYVADIPSGDEIKLNSSTFSPDQDGFEDALTINYTFAETGLVSNVNIYSDKGLLMRKLAKNVTLGSSGAWVWDGLDENNERAAIGIYLIHIEVFNVKGEVKTYVKPCVLAAKLN